METGPQLGSCHGDKMFPIAMVIKYPVSGQAGKQTSNIAFCRRNLQQGMIYSALDTPGSYVDIRARKGTPVSPWRDPLIVVDDSRGKKAGFINRLL